MKKVLVIYHSQQYGNTQAAAELVAAKAGDGGMRGNLPVEMTVEGQPEWAPVFELPLGWLAEPALTDELAR